MAIPASNATTGVTVSQIAKVVMSSAAEAKLGALFINCREAVPARPALEIMGHKQPLTPVQTNNTAALGVVNSSIASKRLKSMDMELHWFPLNLGDYVTKHHVVIHHRAVRGTCLTLKSKLDLLQRRARNAPTA